MQTHKAPEEMCKYDKQIPLTDSVSEYQWYYLVKSMLNYYDQYCPVIALCNRCHKINTICQWSVVIALFAYIPSAIYFNINFFCKSGTNVYHVILII